MTKDKEMLGKFNKEDLARSFSNRTIKMSMIILGDDGKYWVVTMAQGARLLKAGYEAIR
jgi:hypothetical protein